MPAKEIALDAAAFLDSEQARALLAGGAVRPEIARRVVEEYHGGKLYIRESAPGEGTTMVISLNA